jgi:hypothetical protein
MPFIELPGIKGKVFVPEDVSLEKKHNCPDCMNCQWCSDDRCEACLKSHCNRSRKNLPDDNSCAGNQNANMSDANNNSGKE